MQNMHYVDGKNFDVDQLMDVAEHWYKLLVRDNNWKPSKEANNCIIKLTAEIASIGRGNNSEKYKVDKKKKVEKANKGKGKKEESNTSDTWKSTAPKEGDPHTKTVGKRTFTWCPHHKYWGGGPCGSRVLQGKQKTEHYSLNKDSSSEGGYPST